MKYTSRSAMERADRCLRARLYEYHWGRTGIVPNSFNMDMEIGSAVHVGLGTILQAMKDERLLDGDRVSDAVAMNAAGDALDYFNGVLEANGANASEDVVYQYQIEEAQALIQAFVYGWGIYRAESFNRQYEVLDVEREELYPLAPGIILQGRIDAIVANRETEEVKLVSWKTIKEYTERTEKAAQHDNQGISETICAEYGLMVGESRIKSVVSKLTGEPAGEVYPTVVKSLNKALTLLGVEPLRWAPSTTVSSVLMGYLLKGEKTRDSHAPEGISRYIYSSPLIRGWRKWNEAVQEWEYAWCYTPPSSSTKSGKTRLGKGWERFDAWSEFEGGILAWLDLLMEVNEDGVQVVQPEAGNCIKEQLVEVEFCRNEREVESWKRQRRHSEGAILGNVELVLNDAAEGKDVDVTMDMFFPQNRTSCHYPTDCPFIPACFDPEVHACPEAATDAYGDNLYKIRTPHHEAERKALQAQMEVEQNG